MPLLLHSHPTHHNACSCGMLHQETPHVHGMDGRNLRSNTQNRLSPKAGALISHEAGLTLQIATSLLMAHSALAAHLDCLWSSVLNGL